MNLKNIPIITPEIINSLGLNKNSVKSTLYRLQKQGEILRIKRGVYINPKLEINIFELSNIIFSESYLSLDTILFENGIIKQYSNGIYSVSNKSKSEIIKIGKYNLYNYKTSININLGVFIDENGVRKACVEKAILDSIYFKISSKNYPGDSEMTIASKSINIDLMEKLLQLYPERVQKYYLKLINE